MKKPRGIIVLLICILAACSKDNDNSSKITIAADGLSLEEVRQWYRPDTTLNINWSSAEQVIHMQKSLWLVSIAGRPKFQQMKLGYRRLLFYRDSSSQIRERVLEIIPDGLYLQRTNHVSPQDFTGRIFIYDTKHHLLGGRIIANGQLIGTIRQANNSIGNLHTDLVDVSTSCTWQSANYVDADGNAVIYEEKICKTNISDDGSGGILDGNNPVGSSGTTGGGGSGGPGPGPATPPPVSNLPGETKKGVKSAELIKCFDNIQDKGATMKVTVYVEEPWPGTTFNMGPNSVGHTAIGLTKTNGTQSITQIMGFYPDATGLDKLHCPSKIVDNGGDLEYNVSISYNVSAGNFKKISDYLANPPATYDLSTFNCTSFVYAACSKGGITLPDPYNTVGPSGPPGSGVAMAPAGLGDSIEKLKGQSNVNTKGGVTPNSKGPCK